MPESLKAQVATDPPYDPPWSFFDLAEISLYAGFRAIAEGGKHEADQHSGSAAGVFEAGEDPAYRVVVAARTTYGGLIRVFRDGSLEELRDGGWSRVHGSPGTAVLACAVNSQARRVTLLHPDGTVRNLSTDGVELKRLKIESPAAVNAGALADAAGACEYASGSTIVIRRWPDTSGGAGDARVVPAHRGRVRSLVETAAPPSANVPGERGAAGSAQPAASTPSRSGARRPPAEQSPPSARPLLLSASDDFTVGVTDIEAGRLVSTLGDYGQPRPLIDVDPHEEIAILPFERTALSLYHLRKDERDGEPRRFDIAVTAVRFFARGPGEAQRLAVGLADGRVFLSDQVFREFVPLVGQPSAPVTALEWLKSLGILAAVLADGTVFLIDFTQSGDPRVTRLHEQVGPLVTAVFGTGEGLLCAGAAGELLMIRRQGVTDALRRQGERIRALAVGPDDPFVTAVLTDGTVQTWPSPESEPRASTVIAELPSACGACTIVPRPTGIRDRRGRDAVGRYAAVCGLDDGRLAVVTGTKGGGADVTMAEGHVAACNGLTQLQTGNHVVSWSLDGSLRLWEFTESDTDAGAATSFGLRQVGASYSRAPFIAMRSVNPARLYALDALGGAWLIRTPLRIHP